MEQGYGLPYAKYMLEIFEDHLNDGCINGIAEIFDGEIRTGAEVVIPRLERRRSISFFY